MHDRDVNLPTQRQLLAQYRCAEITKVRARPTLPSERHEPPQVDCKKTDGIALPTRSPGRTRGLCELQQALTALSETMAPLRPLLQSGNIIDDLGAQMRDARTAALGAGCCAKASGPATAHAC